MVKAIFIYLQFVMNVGFVKLWLKCQCTTWKIIVNGIYIMSKVSGCLGYINMVFSEFCRPIIKSCLNLTYVLVFVIHNHIWMGNRIWCPLKGEFHTPFSLRSSCNTSLKEQNSIFKWKSNISTLHPVRHNVQNIHIVLILYL